jgi:hypothetical protein
MKPADTYFETEYLEDVLRELRGAHLHFRADPGGIFTAKIHDGGNTWQLSATSVLDAIEGALVMWRGRSSLATGND